jgi:putative ABC transport system permease protein
MNTLLMDLRFALRKLAKNPGFAAIMMLTFALGIGATTAIFSVVYGVLLRPLPYSQPDQILRLWEVNETGHQMNFADPNFEDVRQQSRTLASVAEYSSGIESISGGSEPSRTMVSAVSQDFFKVMGVQPVFGRGFLADEQKFGGAPVALVRNSFWKQSLNSTPDLTSVKLRIENKAFTVVGVLPAWFNFPDDSEVWVPREIYERLPSRSAHNWEVIGRLRDGTRKEEAAGELSGIAARIKQQFANDANLTGIATIPLREATTGSVRPTLLLLLGATFFLLLIACANVANLLLAQSASRVRELVIRVAMGAEQTRLLRQFLTEGLLISLLGGGLGVLAARWGIDALLALAPGKLPRLEEVKMNAPVALFALGLTIAIGISLGVLNALRSARGNLRAQLAEGGQRLSGELRSYRMGRLLIAGQLGASIVLLVGAGLLGRSLTRVLTIKPGFNVERVLTMNLALPSAGWDMENDERAGEARVRLVSQILDRIHGLPGAGETGGTNCLPMGGSFLPDGTYILFAPGEALPSSMDGFEKLFHDASRTGQAVRCVVGGNYFQALGIPLLHGRFFDARDTMAAPHSAVISASLAREKWPGQDPLGHLIEFGNMDGDVRLLTVVGVVADIRAENLEKEPFPTIYMDYRQRPKGADEFTVVMRTEGHPDSFFVPAQRIVREIDPSIPPRFKTFSQVLAGSLESRRFSLLLMTIFSATALLLSLAGIYGVTTYHVSRRTPEIGLRMALGATVNNVMALVIRQEMLAVLVGIAVGLVAAFAMARAMQSMLFGIGSGDPYTFLGVSFGMAVVALVACYIPARRATHVDPLSALRYE